MSYDYLQIIILYCLRQLKGERTSASIFHLLKGKKSSQTIQDAHLFQLTNLFQVFPSLQRDVITQTIKFFQEDGIIERQSSDCFFVTNKGNEQLDTCLQQYPLPKYLNGWRYHHVTNLFWQRLSLLVQVSSHLINHDPMYIPVQRNDETKDWIKTFIQSKKLSRTELAYQLHHELLESLSCNKDIDPRTLVLRLTGYKQIGLTNDQAAMKLEMDPFLFTIHFLNVIHYLIIVSNHSPMTYQLLSEMSKHASLPLTNSTRTTYELLKKGYTIEQMMHVRQLKRGTIEDHLIEIALNDDLFTIEQFVDEKKRKKILQAAETTMTKQLRVIKDQVPFASYFEIRLVLAKYGDQQWN